MRLKLKLLKFKLANLCIFTSSNNAEAFESGKREIFNSAIGKKSGDVALFSEFFLGVAKCFYIAHFHFKGAQSPRFELF